MTLVNDFFYKQLVYKQQYWIWKRIKKFQFCMNANISNLLKEIQKEFSFTENNLFFS